MIKLSRSKLELPQYQSSLAGRYGVSESSLFECLRCFWLQYKKGIRQPEGIVSRLANRFDTVLKDNLIVEGVILSSMRKYR